MSQYSVNMFWISTKKKCTYGNGKSTTRKPISVILSNIYLDKFDKESETRNLRFVRHADDCIIFVKSEMSANRVMKTVASWLERKLFLKVSATKTKVVRPTK
ncbi:MAG: reverse transcriptase domain-containing protein [Beduini sp.]